MVEKCVICGTVLIAKPFFHMIPSDGQRRKQWLSLISNDLGRYAIHKDSALCPDHFSPEDYDCFATGKLKDSAVPRLPYSDNQNTENCIKNQIQNNVGNVDVEELISNTTLDNFKQNNNPNGDLDEFVLKNEEITIKDESVMKVACNETNTLVDLEVQMKDVENVEPSDCNSQLNRLVEEVQTAQMENSDNPGTKSVNSLNSLDTFTQNIGNLLTQNVGIPQETLPEDDEFDEANRAFEVADKVFDVLKHYIKHMKAVAKDREKKLRDNIQNLEVTRKKQILHMERMEKEKKALIDHYEDKLCACHTEINVLRTTIFKKNLEDSQDPKSREFLEYKNRLSNLSRELAHVKVSLTNCKEEKAKLEQKQGLGYMRMQIQDLKKKLDDASESCKLKAIKEHEMEQEIETLKSQLEYAMGVCRIVGVGSDDIKDMEKIEEKLRKSKDKLFPKRWKNEYVASKLKKEQRPSTKLAKKIEECRQLKKELARLRKLSDECGNTCKLSDVCEYCGM